MGCRVVDWDVLDWECAWYWGLGARRAENFLTYFFADFLEFPCLGQVYTC